MTTHTDRIRQIEAEVTSTLESEFLKALDRGHNVISGNGIEARIRQMGEQADEMAAAALGVGTYERWSDEFASKRDAAFAQLVAEDCARACEDVDDESYPHTRKWPSDAAEAIRARYILKD